MIKGNVKKILVSLLVIAMISTSISSVIAFEEDRSWQIKTFDATPDKAKIYETINFVLEIGESDSGSSSNPDSNTNQQSGAQSDEATTSQLEDYVRFSGDGYSTDDNYVIISSSNTQSKYHYKIDFGDKTSIAGYTNNERIEFTHRYKQSGEYAPRATVKNIDKNSVKERNVLNPITIEDGDLAPVAIINAPYSAQEEESVLFDGSESYDPDGEIVSYKWTFGDGNTASGMTAEHAFTDKGSYHVVLEVTDNDGLSSKTTFLIFIDIKKPKPSNYGDVDQSQQDTSGGYVEIYGGVRCAQSFVTSTYEMLTGVRLYVERDFRIINDDSTGTGNSDSAGQNNGGVSASEDDSKYPLLRVLNKLGRNRFVEFIKTFLTKIKNIFKPGSSGSGNDG
ncbi:MAG TPA: PKD domain-containing protein, partial [Ignavibacteria bacterium]|nr:PKD domain-containing protein [Ignavibacteria bacterium]